MKRFVLFLFLLISVNCFAQDLEERRINDFRTISAPTIFTGDPAYPGCWSYGLSAMKADYSPSIQYIFRIIVTGTNAALYPEEPQIAIRLFDGQVITLRAASVGDIETKNFAAMLGVDINEAQIKQLKKGIKKIRIEMKNDYVEHIYEKDECGLVLYEYYEKIKAQLAKPPKSFMDGF